MKGFKKDGKFRPTGKKTKSNLKKSDVRKKGSLSEKRKWEMRNGLNSMDIAESSVKQEGEIGKELSDLQEHRLRRGVGSGDPESKTLDSIEGKFITEDKAKKYR